MTTCYRLLLDDYRTKFLSDDWMVQRNFIDEQEHASEKNAWLVVFFILISILWLTKNVVV